MDTVVDIKMIVSFWQAVLEISCVHNLSVELAECGKCCSSHPDNEVLILKAVVVWVFCVQLIHRSWPVGRFSIIFESIFQVSWGILKLDFLVRLPSNIFKCQVHIDLLWRALEPSQFKCVCKVRCYKMWHTITEINKQNNNNNLLLGGSITRCHDGDTYQIINKS